MDALRRYRHPRYAARRSVRPYHRAWLRVCSGSRLRSSAWWTTTASGSSRTTVSKPSSLGATPVCARRPFFRRIVYHIHDAVKDARTLANPLVAGALGLRFYAAAPLRTHDGFNLGTLCVIDREPRELGSGRSGDAYKAGGAGHGPDGAAIGRKEGRRTGGGRAQDERATARGKRGAENRAKSAFAIFSTKPQSPMCMRTSIPALFGLTALR